MVTILNGIYLILFVLFCFFTLNHKYMYSAFLFLVLGARGLSFLPAMTIKPKLFPFLCLLIFCMVNFKNVQRNIKSDKIVRSAFHLCLFFIFSIAFSIFYWRLSIMPVLNAGLPYMLMLSIVVFIPLDNKQYHKLFTIVFYITFVATIIYIIQCF